MPAPKLNTRDLLSIADLCPPELLGLLSRSQELRTQSAGAPLKGKTVALVFEKPSLRTRVSFEVAITQLGGHPIYLGKEEVGLGTREPISDLARVLSRMVDGIVCRTFKHSDQEELASFCSVPVINGLSNVEHPCQAVADLLTIQEHRGKLAGVTVAFVGDGNNVAASLALACAAAGVRFRIASPEGYELASDVVDKATATAGATGAEVCLLRSPQEAVEGADVVYTDVWASMGQEKEAAARRRAFEGYQVNEALLAGARPDAIIMHDMPAHYGDEVPPGFLDHPRSVAFDQAENRLHSTRAILEALLTR
jgi:ornithine carbamoyltransferase